MKIDKEVKPRLTDRQRDRTRTSLTQLPVEVSQKEGKRIEGLRIEQMRN